MIYSLTGGLLIGRDTLTLEKILGIMKADFRRKIRLNGKCRNPKSKYDLDCIYRNPKSKYDLDCMESRQNLFIHFTFCFS